MRFALLAMVLVGCSSKTPSFNITPEQDAAPHLDAGADVSQSDAGPSPGLGYVVGSRLRPRVFSASDGSEQFAGWFDPMTSENCTFRLAYDGVQRCLPDNVADFSSQYYADASCKTRLALAAKSCGPKYASQIQIAPCGNETSIYGLTPFNAQGSFVWQGNNCTQVPIGNVAQFDVFVVGAETPPATFQDAKLVTK